MVGKIQIQVFVSCPGDVEPQKKIIRSICETLNNSNEGYNTLHFKVEDWRDFVGQYGIRNQEQINDYIGEYDVYIGVLWKRFGTKTGAVNPVTGKDYFSGTEEEFTIAKQRWDEFKTPDIHFFIRTDKREVNSVEEYEQLGQVVKFVESQKKLHNNFLTEFGCEDEFRNGILFILNRKQQKTLQLLNIAQKKKILENPSLNDFLIPRLNIDPPAAYVKRYLVHFSSLIEKQVNFNTNGVGLINLFEAKSRIVILGDAGSGKSTELRNLAFTLNDKDSAYFPLYKNLNTYTPEIGLDNFLPDFWKKVPENLLILIWDGLDEIQPKDFNSVVRQISSFSEKHKEIKIIISCRTNFYELPTNNSPGTLPNFEPYFIADFNTNDIKEYFEIKYGSSESQNFLNEIAKYSLGDFASKPFFLLVLADLFEGEKNLKADRKILFETFLFSRINLDENHYKGTFEIRNKKQEIIELLGRTALSMEILSRNHISENELLKIMTSKEFETLKYCTAFKKKEDKEDTWQFEHNNIQEYLAAKCLAVLDLKKVLNFIAFEPDHKRLIPSWINTLTFLVSIIDKEALLFKELLEWVVANEKEIIVKFEREKLSESLRNEIFQNIFNYYKSYDVWISSNKFSAEELGHFAQSSVTIDFLKSEISATNNSRIAKLNAINILGHLQFSVNQKLSIQSIFLGLIDDNINDHYFIFSVIHALRNAKINSMGLIEALMKKIGSSKNQHIRAAIYSILLNSDHLEYYIGYLIEGFDLVDNKRVFERGNVSLFDETYYLREAIASIKSPSNIKLLIEYISGNDRFYYRHSSEFELIERIITNAVVAYAEDETIFSCVLEMLVKEIKHYRDERIDFIIKFFDKTNTGEQAFLSIWTMRGDKNYQGSIILAKLATENELEIVIEKYNNHDITNDELQRFYYDLKWVNPPLYELFANLINQHTKHRIEQQPIIDYESIRKVKLHSDFDLLFNAKKFQTEVLRIFEDLDKDVLTFDELYEIRKKKVIELDDQYAGTALRLLRDFGKAKSNVSKDKVISWLDNDKNVEWYLVSLIYEYLSNNPDLELTSFQQEWTSAWTFKSVKEVKFKEALTFNENGGISIKKMANYVSYFTKKLNLTHSKDVLLDMLSFDFLEGHQWVGVSHILKKLSKDQIKERIFDNFKNGILSDPVLKNHIIYAVENQLVESYSYILKELANKNRKDYLRIELLDIYYKWTKDTTGLIDILPTADPALRWRIIEHLIESPDKKVAENFLVSLMENDPDLEERLQISNHLIKLQNPKGLEIFVDLMRGSHVHLGHSHNLNQLTQKNAIPYLIELLEISYQADTNNDEFHSLNSIVLGAFNNLALFSEENFLEVINKLHLFIKEHSLRYKNVNYLLPFIERLENQFYMNKAQTYTIDQVIGKLSLIKT